MFYTACLLKLRHPSYLIAVGIKPVKVFILAEVECFAGIRLGKQLNHFLICLIVELYLLRRIGFPYHFQLTESIYGFCFICQNICGYQRKERIIEIIRQLLYTTEVDN